MRNNEKYKKAAELVENRLSENDILDFVEEHQTKRKMPLRRLAAVCASLLIALMLGVTAYASDFGGFRHQVNVWLHGSMDEAVIEQIGDGQFTVTYSDGSVRSCGGVAYDNDQPRGLTMDEMVDSLLTSAEAEKDENGRYWLYIRDHKIDITDQINEKGWAQEMVKDGWLADYITVVWYGDDSCGIMTSHRSFPTLEEIQSSTRVF